VLPALLDEYRERKSTVPWRQAACAGRAEACGSAPGPIQGLPSDYWLHVKSAGQDKPVVHSVPVWETMSGHQASMQQFIRAIRVA